MHYLYEYLDRPFIINRDSVLTYRLFFKNVNMLAKKFEELGIKHGDKVGYFNKNSYMFPIVLFALGKIGATILPINIRFPALQVIELLNDLNVSHIIVSKLYIDENFERDNKIVLEDLINIHEDYPDEADTPFIIEEYLDQDATIIFTSGSTGTPKAALHSYGNHYYSALGSNENINLKKNDRWLAILPTYHVGGISIFFRAYLAGATIVIPDTNMTIIENISRNKVSHVSFVATQIYRMLDDERQLEILSNLKCILLGGSAMPAGLITKCFHAGLNIHVSYGSTEMSSQITTTNSGASKEELLSSGTVLPHRELLISESGEILVKGKTLFKGYLQHGKLFSRLDENGWYHTGDLGKIDKNGLLTVYGRQDNMFISGGENIQPEEIEKELCKIDYVLDAVVVGISDSEFGQRPVAFVKLEDNYDINTEELNKELSKTIARYKIPTKYLKFPENMSELNLKVDRQYFRKIAENPSSFDMVQSIAQVIRK